MIVRNEEGTLAVVLHDASSFCDELVVIDTGSTDRTVEIAREAGARVETFAWVDDFAAARNAAFDACTSDWIIWLDADDRVEPETQDALRLLKAGELSPEFDAVYMTYRYHFTEDGSTPTFTTPRERIIRRGAGLVWQHKVHEIITLPDPVRALHRLDLAIDHRPLRDVVQAKVGRNLRILRQAVSDGDRCPRTLFYLGNELRDHRQFLEALSTYDEYLDKSAPGWERHAALVSAAKCAGETGQGDRELALAHQAVLEDPRRAEAFMVLGLHHYRREEWDRAIPYFAAATALPVPRDGFVVRSDYTYSPWDFLSLCHHRRGEQRKALEALLNAVAGNPERERLLDNARWFLAEWDGSPTS